MHHTHGYRPDRRNFLRGAAAAAVGSAALNGEGSAEPDRGPSAKVGVVQNSTVAQAVREAVEMSGGLDFIKPGQRVLIKTNATGAVKHPGTTNPEVIHEVVRMTAEAGCTDIYVGDRSFFVYSDVMKILKQVGHYDAAMQAQSELGRDVKVTVLSFDDAGAVLAPGSDMWRTIIHPKAKHYTDEAGNNVGFRLAEILFQMDHVINIPCCKTHFQAWFTMAMKSFVGMSHPDTRKYFHRYASTNDLLKQRDPGLLETQPDVRPFTNRLVELNLGFAPSLNIIDATIPMVNGGPSNGDSETANVIIASRDRIAADVAGIALLRTLGTERRLQELSPWSNPMVHYARKLGIGVRYPDRVELLHKGMTRLEEFQANMA